VAWKAAGRLRDDGKKCRAAIADSLFGVAYYPSVVALATDACARLFRSRFTRWFGATASSRLLGLVLASRMLVHVPYLYVKKFDHENRPLFLVHHLLVIVVYGGGFVLRKGGHFFGAAAALCESTNVFLTVEELLLFTRDEPSTLRRWNRLLLTLSYVLTRLVLFPAVLALFFVDVRNVVVFDRLDVASLGLFELVAYPLAMLVVFAMSLHWAITALRSGAWAITETTRVTPAAGDNEEHRRWDDSVVQRRAYYDSTASSDVARRRRRR